MTDRQPSGRELPPLNRPRKSSRRGFAAMDPERRLALARKGGASVPGHLRSFAQDRALASSAGVKGGKARHNPKRPPDAPGDD